MDVFKEIGYSMLYAFDNPEIYEIHRAIPDLVRLVIAEVGDVRACHEFGRPGWAQELSDDDIARGALVTTVAAEAQGDHQIKNHTLFEWIKLENEGPIGRWQNPVFYGHLPARGQRFSDHPNALDSDSPDFEPHEEWRCVQTPDFPQGIPIWKMFGFYWWTGTDIHPLGGQWTMSPEPYGTFPGISHYKEFNMYTGYSIEAYCGDVFPAEDRRHRTYILAKQSEYFIKDTFALTSGIFNDTKNETGIEFVAGIGKPDSPLPILGVNNIGFQSIPDFLYELGHSKALVGVGRPWISPTPYDALCMGVPFINPILDWDKKNPDDITKWKPQHEGLSDVGEPWVYNVKKGNATEIKNAIMKAVATPIEPFIPRRMTQAAMRARYRLIVETDWKAVYNRRSGNEDVGV
jgi:hypothetical protein